jgi:hypothetical protein
MARRRANASLVDCNVTSVSLWSELVPYDELMRPALLRELAARDVGLLVAVTPGQEIALVPVVRACHRAGVNVGVWPMLSHAEGRWPNARNVDRFAEFSFDLLARLHDDKPDAFAIDLEPAIADMPDLIAADPAAIARQLRRGLRRRVRERFAGLSRSIQDRGIPIVAAALPFVMTDSSRHVGGWQRLFGTPVDALAATRVSYMVYTSMIEGYARGMLRREDAVALLAAAARASSRRHGSGASLSLGAVGVGILGDEPTYRSPRELAEDVAIARGAGVPHLAVFSLGGMMRRPPLRGWLDALDAAPAHRELTARAATAAATCVALSRVIEWGHRGAALAYRADSGLP